MKKFNISPIYLLVVAIVAHRKPKVNYCGKTFDLLSRSFFYFTKLFPCGRLLSVILFFKRYTLPFYVLRCPCPKGKIKSEVRKIIKKDYFNVSQAVITEDNVQRIAELVSLKSLKMLCQFSQKAFVKLYKGLIQDVYYSDECSTHTFSDGYDIVQTAICFLCEHMGKRMDTVISMDKKGNPVDIKRACFKVVNHQVHKYTYVFNKFRSVDLPTEKEYVASEKLYEEQDYSVVDETLEKMKLNQGQQDVLDCFINGMSYRQAARYLDVAVSTVFRRRLKIQMLYNAL